MTGKEEKLLAEFESKLERLILFCDSLKSENASLKREMLKKEEIIKELMLDNEKIRKRYDNIKVARSFSLTNNNEEIQLAKKRLSKLVQDVDKCIAILKS